MMTRRVLTILSTVLLSVGVVLAGCTDVFADGATTPTVKVTKKSRKAATPSLPTGVARTRVAAEDYPGGARIKDHRNALGQTVYSVAASHFDISPPLLQMAATAGPDPKGEDDESPTNPQIPPWRIIHSDVPDPVVQSAIPPVASLGEGPVAVAAPTAGFNFLGVGIATGSPSDSNGSVGNNQFVETVNVRYRVWTLNHATKVATPATAAANINTLWTGFGGVCEAQNSGDPIVLYDKVANRWLISQLATGASGGFYYQCVAVSTTSNATGTYARYAFAVPGGYFGDYPHYGVWTDAYYMTANAFLSTAGGFVGGIFAALDRTKMLAGDPAATWQVIVDPNEAGHRAADLDGFSPPPTNAPGVFVSIDTPGVSIYRMHVDFATPANTVRTVQAVVPVAPANAACNGGFCIPQPGTSVLLESYGGALMHRAAYRNFLDHESIVVSESVDPGVSGVAAGVRWYDFRLSGTPDGTCPAYPCIYQQGTIADVPNGRSRWMPSIAMDSAENILVGYSTSGKTAGTENHSIRYTGRAKGDPPGVMTAPETTIVNGTANFTGNGRWGDYTSMSVDPFDDCTFWYVNQYYTVTNRWSTQIASATFPAGSGPGQCPVTTCTSRPASAPTIGSASVAGPNQLAVSWTGIAPQPGAYAIERAVGACGSEGLYQPLASVAGNLTSFTDTTVLGGLSYSYRVIAASDAAGTCQALVATGCASATATGTCNLKPVFTGAAGGTSSNNSTCGVTLNWAAAASRCPLTPNIRYNIFRGTTPDFVPAVGNRIATCVAGPTSYLDSLNVSPGVTYYYVVRAEDDSTENGGECGGGNEDTNSAVVLATAFAAGTQAAPGTWLDGGGDGTSFLALNVAGPGDTSHKAWRFVRTADDAGANHTPGGAYAYRNAGPAIGSTYASSVCAETRTPSLTAAATAVNLQYWERHLLEYKKDAVAVEYSVNGGPFTDIPAPSNDPGVGCSASDGVGGWETLECAQDPPTNACGYPDTKIAFTGLPAGGESCVDWTTNSFVTAYAHRCHPITGLAPGDTIQFRWRFASTPTGQYAGFYLDDIAVTNVKLPNACVPDACFGQPNGTGCDDGDACTTADACTGGTCAGTPASPPESQNVRAQADKTTYVWDPTPNSTQYDVLRGSLSALPVGPGGGDEVCFGELATPAVVDAATPAPGDGFWYLSRGQGACGIGSYGTRSNGAPRSSTTCP